MLVDNYYKGLLRYYCGPVNGISPIEKGGMQSGFDSERWNAFNWNAPLTDIYFGSDNTPPTKEDYWLRDENGRIEELIIQKTIHQYEILEDGIKITKIMNIYNSGTEPVTIGEMVWQTLFNSGYISSSWGILDRTTFDEPIILLPGESKQINYSIFFKYGS